MPDIARIFQKKIVESQVVHRHVADLSIEDLSRVSEEKPPPSSINFFMNDIETSYFSLSLEAKPQLSQNPIHLGACIDPESIRASLSPQSVIFN